jgi:chaperonin GroES
MAESGAPAKSGAQAGKRIPRSGGDPMAKKLRPLQDRLIVRRLEAENKSPGGIVIPDTATEKPIQGKVIAVGKGRLLDKGGTRPLDVKVGDRILFGKFAGTEVKLDGEEYLVLKEDDVMAVLLT